MAQHAGFEAGQRDFEGQVQALPRPREPWRLSPLRVMAERIFAGRRKQLALRQGRLKY